MKFPDLIGTLARRMGRLGPRDRRALRLGAWLVIPPLAYVWVARPAIVDFGIARDRLVAERDLYRREAGLVQDATRFPERLAQVHAASARAHERVFPGTDPVSGTATVTRYVTDRAARYRVMVQGSEAQPPAPTEQGLVRLTVQLRVIGDLAGLTSWLNDLERGPRLVSVERLRLTTSERGNAEGTSDEEVLGLTLRMTGLMLAPPDTAVHQNPAGRP